MRDTELKRMRDQALYQVYKEGLEKGAFASLREAGHYTANHKAPSFFIDARTASLAVSKMEQGYALLHVSPSTHRKIKVLYERYKEWRAKHPFSILTMERALEVLVDEEAPEFFLEDESARKIIQRMCKEKRDTTIERLK